MQPFPFLSPIFNSPETVTKIEKIITTYQIGTFHINNNLSDKNLLFMKLAKEFLNYNTLSHLTIYNYNGIYSIFDIFLSNKGKKSKSYSWKLSNYIQFIADAYKLDLKDINDIENKLQYIDYIEKTSQQFTQEENLISGFSNRITVFKNENILPCFAACNQAFKEYYENNK